jgi:hypothetical protein
MKLPSRISRRQLALPLAHDMIQPQADESMREALVKALADLLLETIGKEVEEPVKSQGDSDES